MRTFLGTGGEIKKSRVFLDADCIEVEEEQYVDIVRHRVYLDDIAMVTRSRRLGWTYLARMGVAGGIFGIMALGFALGKEYATAAICTVPTLGFGIAFLYRILTKVDVITIFGRRKRVEIAYIRKKEKIAQHFEQLVTAIREKIAVTAARIEREKPTTPAADLGPMPEGPPVLVEVPPALETQAVPIATDETALAQPVAVESFHELPTPPPVTSQPNPD